MIKTKIDKVAFCSRLIGMILLIVCFFTPFASAITLSSGNVRKTYGPFYSFIFGTQISTNGLSYSTRVLSGLGLAAFVLMAVATILLILSFLGYKRKRL